MKNSRNFSSLDQSRTLQLYGRLLTSQVTGITSSTETSPASNKPLTSTPGEYSPTKRSTKPSSRSCKIDCFSQCTSTSTVYWPCWKLTGVWWSRWKRTQRPSFKTSLRSLSYRTFWRPCCPRYLSTMNFT